jgi:hypothetical protein
VPAELLVSLIVALTAGLVTSVAAWYVYGTVME